MASQNFQLVNDQTFLPADVSNGTIYTSPEQLNGTGAELFTGMRLILDYHDLQSSPTSARLQAVVEGKSEQGQFYTLGYQFCDFRKVGVQQRRQIVFAPELFILDPGIDNIIFFGGQTVEQISNQQGVLTDIWRVKIAISDPNSGFVSARMSVYGQLSNSTEFIASGSILFDPEGDVVTNMGNPVII